jgi:hypothetical protein
VEPLGICIEGEARQATYRLNCSGEFTRARFGHSEVFEKMTNEWPSLLASGDKIVPIIAFGRRFLAKFPPSRKFCHQMVLFSARTVHSLKARRVLRCFLLIP